MGRWETINEEALKGIQAQTLSDPSPAPEVEQSVPPIKTKPFHAEPRSAGECRINLGVGLIDMSGSSFRSSASQRLSATSASRKPSGRQSGQSQPASSRAASVRSMSSSGRVRTGGFQHLNSHRDE